MALVLFQFPTPPAAAGSDAAVRTGAPFLLSDRVAERTAEALASGGAGAGRARLLGKGGGGGALDFLDGRPTAYVASNVEDGAVRCAAALERAGLPPLPAPDPRVALPAGLARSRRDRRYEGPRALGARWLSASPLPPRAAPDSERRCEALGLPVHRFCAASPPPD